jgi:peroxiredoxin
MAAAAAAAGLALALAAPGAAQTKDRPRQGNLNVGDPAPNFKLKSPDGKREVELASFKGKKPVVLVFGSYT